MPIFGASFLADALISVPYVRDTGRARLGIATLSRGESKHSTARSQRSRDKARGRVAHRYTLYGYMSFFGESAVAQLSIPISEAPVWYSLAHLKGGTPFWASIIATL